MTRHVLLSSLLILSACAGDDTDTDTDTDTDVVTTDVYAFDGRTGEGSVVHTGQTLRQVLIADLKGRIGGLTGRVDGGYFPQQGEVRAELDFYFQFDADSAGSVEHDIAYDLPVSPATYGEIGSADLIGKIAGNDEVGQHKDWGTEFEGWDAEGVTTPQSLVEAWFDELDAAAVARANGNVPTGPDGAPLPAVHLTEDGRDLQQLVEKFLRGSIAFSQGADDYLDDDIDGKGLLSSHAEVDEGKTYTPLEHQWDEGFAYFGASHDFGLRDPADVASQPWHDTDGDGTIDLGSEVSWGHATNASKRDNGAVVATDFSAQAWEGFLQGRALLDATDGELTDDELDTLRGHRDQAVEAWEKAIAATAVHYINDTLQDMSAMDSDDYSFADHAKHWSELKGFALSFQFNPRSPLSDADFVELHTLIGTAPVLSTATAEERAAYADDLRAARTLLGEAYDFDADNLGGEDGTGGW